MDEEDGVKPAGGLISSVLFLYHRTVESLLKSKSVTKSKYDVHKIVMGRNDFTGKDITVQAHAFTQSAREAIENAGGKCEVLKPSTGAVISA